MGELPHFISGVPEESINKQTIQNLPQKQFVAIFEDWTGAGTNREIYKVPKGKVLEITHASISLINGVAANSFGRLFVSDGLGAADDFTLLIDNVDHKEHDHVNQEFAPLSVFANEGKQIRFEFATAAGSIMSAIVFGFLISKQELIEKTNIVI